jgi:hypothetical protein
MLHPVTGPASQLVQWSMMSSTEHYTACHLQGCNPGIKTIVIRSLVQSVFCEQEKILLCGKFNSFFSLPLQLSLSLACMHTKLPQSLLMKIKGGSNMTGTNCDLFTHKSSRSYLNHLVSNHMETAKSAIFETGFYTNLYIWYEQIL